MRRGRRPNQDYRRVGDVGRNFAGRFFRDGMDFLRDISDEKRIAAEREAGRRSHALAEIVTVLAHEIRNPLGSMELFAGLLAGATEEMPEATQWVMHLQAGLRLLAATVNNVLQFHSQPCGELLPVRLDRLLRDTTEFLGPPGAPARSSLCKSREFSWDGHGCRGRAPVATSVFQPFAECFSRHADRRNVNDCDAGRAGPSRVVGSS